ncbi:MAG: TolC family protein [Planctomycetaceae bacterium]|nr:TolC family protein [Planctomycetaceae bacterium]
MRPTSTLPGRKSNPAWALVFGLCLGGEVGCQSGSGIVFPNQRPVFEQGTPTAPRLTTRTVPESSQTAGSVATSAKIAVTPFPDSKIQQATFQDTDLDLSQWISLALERNPEVAVARREVEIASAKIPQVGSLADPMVDVVAWPIYPNVQQQAGGRMIADVVVSQEVPWRGKRESRVAQASGEVTRLQNKLAATELKVANEVRQAYIECWLASQKLEIAQNDRLFLEGLLDLAQTRFEAGTSGQQEVLRIQAEIGLNHTEQSRLTADRKNSLAEFARVIQEPTDFSHDGLPLSFDLMETTLPSWEEVSTQALAANPELQARWAEVQRDQWRVKESQLNYYPDLTYSAGWGVMTARRAISPTADGIDNLTAGVSFNLPVRIASRDAALRESQIQVEKAMREWERQQAEIQRDVRQLHAQLESLAAQLHQYRETIVPSLEQALEVTTTAYEANQATLSELIELRRELLKLRATQKDLQAQWQKSRADLYWLMAEGN